MKEKSLLMIKGLFYAMVAIFVLIAAFFLIPDTANIQRVFFPFLGVLAILFFIYGAVLIFLTLKLKVEKKLKVFLILTGASAIGFPVFVILHNLFYALGILAGNIIVLKYLFEFLHAAFFIIALIVCPIVFIIGIIGVIVKLRRIKKR